MKLLKIFKDLDNQKPLSSKSKEQVMTVFGAAFIIALTITSAFAIDARNTNLVTIMHTETQNTLNG